MSRGAGAPRSGDRPAKAAAADTPLRDCGHDQRGRSMSRTLRLTMAQALVRYLAALSADTGAGIRPSSPACSRSSATATSPASARRSTAIATPCRRSARTTSRRWRMRRSPTPRRSMRRRMMACTTSIGPGATNLVTAAALAHVNRLPVLLLPGDVFVSRAPDPVLQQVEDFHDGTVSANDCFKPVSRYFDRIVHPAQLLTALPRAIHVLTDAALCGPVTLALPQDVQAMAYDYPEDFFAPATIVFRAQPPAAAELSRAAALLRNARRPLIDRRRRRALRAGRRCARRVRRSARRPGRRDASRQGRARLGPSAAARRDRRHRLAGRQRARARRRPGPRGRHAPAGFHHRLALDVRRREAGEPQRQRLRRAEMARGRAGRRRRAGSRRAVAFACALASRAAWPAQGQGGGERLARRGRAHHRPARRRAAVRGRRDRRRAALVARLGGRGHRRLRRRHAARRAAQALAHVVARRLSRRIRLLVHGLRDRRRARRQDGAARARGRS